MRESKYAHFNKETSSLENIILQHSKRGMELLRPYIPENFCARAANAILSWRRGTVFIATGFHVAGTAETDGPPGTAVLANVLSQCGFHVIILTDKYCKGLFENRLLGISPVDEQKKTPGNIQVLYAPINDNEMYYEHLIKTYRPVGMISIERCGRNHANDYTNMRGISIRSKTAAIDTLFLMAYERGIPTVGVGDGGNEIGMGCIADIISEKLSLTPCLVPVDFLVIATVSNWGAYGICAYIRKMESGISMPKTKWLKNYLETIVSQGCVDGVLGKCIVGVDGFPSEYEYAVYEAVCS